jgi:hypothetical protein
MGHGKGSGFRASSVTVTLPAGVDRQPVPAVERAMGEPHGYITGTHCLNRHCSTPQYAEGVNAL